MKRFKKRSYRPSKKRRSKKRGSRKAYGSVSRYSRLQKAGRRR